MDIKELVKKKNGDELLLLAEQGDHTAGLEFAKLVFVGSYAGNTEGGITKKAAKDKARQDAMLLVVNGAERGVLTSIEEAADMFFLGRREPGAFGGVALVSNHAKSIEMNNLLLAHEDSSDSIKSLAHFRLGILSKPLNEDTNEDKWVKTIHHWEASSSLTGAGSVLATAALGRYYFYEKIDYSKAIPLLESVFTKNSYSALILALAYKNGNGVSINQDKYNELLAIWESEDKG